MITVGITGRSGCGKSTVTACFAARGVPVADADQISRQVLQPGSPVLAQLAARFGGDILSGEGVLDRRLLADRAFATPEGKADLDAITHPAIVRRIEAARQAAQAAGSPLFVIDGAVLVGSVIDGIWDRLIVVTAPYEVSVARIVARDGIRPEMARRRLDAQLPEAALAARADFLLANDGTREQLHQKAEALAARLLAEAERGGGLPV
ncbi:MAG TPA: dephospho-CoA kinase [Candidatus Faecalibacterium gallistercoris]|uniref:Dephospho-CoA kinase n=1 Tax=Candidatus Faecalibacterium gallistercoris TaxID=2838579 RepID=A0A9D2JMR7_9FIRM|nr:dephospho-CoA kinase [Candidatus Faecalibacterium gallistercoris]